MFNRLFNEWMGVSVAAISLRKKRKKQKNIRQFYVRIAIIVFVVKINDFLIT